MQNKLIEIPPTFWDDIEKKDFLKYVIYGDTDSLYLIAPTPEKVKSDKEALYKYVEKQSEDINNIIRYNINEQVLKLMNVPEEYNLLLFKTEIVINAMMFIGIKKNYAYSEIIKEGVIHPKPRIEYKGIPILRADTPQITKDMIRELIEDIVLNDDVDEKNIVIEKIVEMFKTYYEKLKDAISRLDIKYFGFPVKWNVSYKNNKLPSRVLGMKFYNTLVGSDVLKPLSSGFSVEIKIKNKTNIEKLIGASRELEYGVNINEVNSLTFLTVPYSFNEEKLKKEMDRCGVYIDVDVVWEKSKMTIVRNIIDTLKEHYKF